MDLSQFSFEEEYYYDGELLTSFPSTYLDELRRIIKNDPSAANRILIDKDERFVYFVYDKIPKKELVDLTPDQYFFYPMCTKEEIKRIYDVQNASDYLLKFRADQIVEHTRLKRVFSSLQAKLPDWNFTEAFSDVNYVEYLDRLSTELKESIRNVELGNIYLKEANGYCIKTPYGNIIVISYALRYFLYYMNLFYLATIEYPEYGEPIDPLTIAIKVMLGSEALDFEIDSRGDIPFELHEKLEELTGLQMQFVLGHELAHHYLGHLEKGRLTTARAMSNLHELGNEKYYNYSEKLELEADYYSVKNANLQEWEVGRFIDASYLFFFYLDVFKCVEDYMFPKSSFHLKTHPDPLNRLYKINEKFDCIGESFSYEDLKEIESSLSGLKNQLVADFLPYYIDELEQYASTYLSKYKGEVIHDRALDY